MVTNKQFRESLLMKKLSLHKPIIRFSVCIDEYGNKDIKVASVNYPNEKNN